MPRNVDTLTRSLQALTIRLDELAAFRDRWTLRLPYGHFRAAGAEHDDALAVGDSWPSTDFPARLTFDAHVPPAWRGHGVHVRLAVGGEGLLLVDGVAIGGLNPYHLEHPVLERAKGGERLRIDVEAVPKNLFGRPNRDPKLEGADLIVPDLELRALYHDLNATLQAATYLAGRERGVIAELLVQALRRTLAACSLPRADTDAYLARLAQSPPARAELDGIWEGWRFTDDPAALTDDARERLPELRALLRAELGAIRDRYPAEGSLWLTGHAHIDLAWLWPLEETRRKARRTFETVLGLMDRYPDFHFDQSSAQLYAYVEEDDPDLFRRIRARVAEGRWDVVGGMWVEPDGNLLAGESWARQLLYGQRYFASRFGVRARVGWLPDTFGYAANLPQLLRQAGIEYFFTTKLTWNESDVFPHDLYAWEGLDGSRVVAHSFFNPNGGYNGHVEPYDLGETWRGFRGKRQHDQSLFAFGYGDGGGGPTAEMLEHVERLRDFPGLPRLETGRVEGFYDRVDPEGLPVWVGEKYLQFHRGTYTTQARTKALHRRLEHDLVAAETAASLAHALGLATYPHAVLTGSWTVLLRNQFHDILPGSSIRSVYETAERELGEAHERVRAARDGALRALSAPAGATDALVVWNLSLDDRPLRFSAPRPAQAIDALDLADGTSVPFQSTDAELIVSADDVTVPGLGYLTLFVRPSAAEVAADGHPTTLHASPTELENAFLRVRVAADGTLASVFDKVEGREVLAGSGNALWLYGDIPREYEAWDIDQDYERHGQRLSATEEPRLVERGPVRASIRVVTHHERSVIEQEYRLVSGGRRLDIVTRVQWHGRRQLLRALFPVAVRHHEAVFETAFGTVARPTHRNTSWDAAQFEVPAHRWADLSEAGYGVALLNDAKYGYSVHGSTIALTLLRAPTFPDPYADEGEHAFTYALYPHAHDWRAGTIGEAHDLNDPLQVVRVGGAADEADGAGQGEGHAHGWPASRAYLTCDTPSLRLAGLKRAEDGDDLVLRLYDAHGARGAATLRFDLPIAAARAVDLLEEPLPDRLAQDVGDGPLEVPFGPYGVATWRLSRPVE